MSRTNRPINPNYAQDTLLGTDFTFLWFQAELIRDLAEGKDRCLPQFVEFVKEFGTVLRFTRVIASGWLQSVYQNPNGMETIFLLDADSIIYGTNNAEVIERTIEVICRPNGNVSIRTFGRRREIPLKDLHESYNPQVTPSPSVPQLRVV